MSAWIRLAVDEQRRAYPGADADIQEVGIAARRSKARFSQRRRPHIGRDGHLSENGERLADSARSPGQDGATLDLAARTDELGHADADLMDGQPGLAACLHDFACDRRCARKCLAAPGRNVRRDRAHVPERRRPQEEEAGPDVRAADVDAEHAALAIARPRPPRRAGHAVYLGATPSRAVAGVEKDRSSYWAPSGTNTASRGPSSKVVDFDFQCVRTISSPDMPTTIASPPCPVFSPTAPAGT